ncbi:uncharacterized protein DUF4124 [Alteromonadaceae bacterium 2753L.S.0a.02]|nr:uncharacterized protein DUF4124 [Alteromonadaceae bacterium 2753L.S.0a.02]
MSLITVIFLAWVGYSLVRGYQKGLWLGLLDILAFLCAYVGSYIWGPMVNASLNWAGLTALGGYLLVYVLIYVCVGMIPKLFVGRVLQSLGRQAFAGAGLGLVTGVVSGLVGIWAYQFFSATASVSNTNTELTASTPDDAPAVLDTTLENTANKLMGEASRMGASLSGAGGLEAELAGKFAEQPAQMMTDLKALGDSAELQTFLTSPHIQQAMRSNNMDALIESPEFQALIRLPAFAEMRDLAESQAGENAGVNQDIGVRDADYFIATQISNIWRKTNNLRSDPEINRLMQDPQVRELLEKKDLAGLMSNSKARELLRRLMSQQEAGSAPINSSGATTQDRAQQIPETAESAPTAEPSQIYQWRDDQGVMRYSDQPPPEPHSNQEN